MSSDVCPCLTIIPFTSPFHSPFLFRLPLDIPPSLLLAFHYHFPPRLSLSFCCFCVLSFSVFLYFLLLSFQIIVWCISLFLSFLLDSSTGFLFCCPFSMSSSPGENPSFEKRYPIQAHLSEEIGSEACQRTASGQRKSTTCCFVVVSCCCGLVLDVWRVRFELFAQKNCSSACFVYRSPKILPLPLSPSLLPHLAGTVWNQGRHLSALDGHRKSRC